MTFIIFPYRVVLEVKKVDFNQMLAQPANTTCTSDKVFFTTLHRTFEGLFTSFFTKRIISPRIFEWYCPYPRLFQNRTSTKNGSVDF